MEQLIELIDAMYKGKGVYQSFYLDMDWMQTFGGNV